MASDANSANFSLNLDGNAEEVSDDLATSLDGLRSSIAKGENSIKELSGSLRKLRGTTTEVKTAKEELKAKINAERDAMSAASLAILKQGTNYDALTKKAKKLSGDGLKATKDNAHTMGDALKKAGGPVGSLAEKMSSLKTLVAESGGAMNLAALAAGGLVAVAVAATVAIGALGVSLAKFIFGAADAARTANLFREAATGSAENAKNLGQQVELLSTKVSTSREKLNELGIELAKTRLGGQQIVDTMNLVAQASDAMGDSVGNTLKEMITRGQQWQNFSLQKQELFGTGIEFKDVAAQLSKNLKIGIEQASAKLTQGRVKLGDGAKALREVVDARFGEVNAKKMLSFDVQLKKVHETFESLTSGVKLEPLLKAVNELFAIFKEDTWTGAALKELVTIFGNGLVGAMKEGTPIAKAFIQGLAIGALRLTIAFFETRNALRDAFGDSKVLKDIDVLKIAVTAGKVAVGLLAVGMTILAAQVALISSPFILAGLAVDNLSKSIKQLKEMFNGMDWKVIGSGITDGLIDGIVPGGKVAVDAVKELARKVKAGFSEQLGIHSPSKVFAEFGQATTEGYERGVNAGAPAAQAATAGMIAPPQASGGKSGGSGGNTFHITIQVQGGGGDAAAQLKEPGFLASLTKALEDGMVAAGVPA